MTRTLHLAVGQSSGALSTPEERIDWLATILPEVVLNGSDLILLPELFASGYNIGEQISERAEEADGRTARLISALAETHRIAIHYGFVERDGSTLFNSAQCFGPDGQHLGAYRKRAIPPGFEKNYFSAGSEYHLFTYRSVRIATLICYDAEFPEAARQVATMGAELILVPTALGEQWEYVSRTLIPTRAYENGVFLAYANSAGGERGLRYLGQSFIATPDGKELARAGAAPEIIYGVLELDKVAAAQKRLPYLIDRQGL